MALFAAGLTAVLRSGTATLALLVPSLLIVSFVVGGVSGTVADFLPDRAGQAVLHGTADGDPGPVAGARGDRPVEGGRSRGRGVEDPTA
ncbi:hypothetical protein QF032_001412 [Streptomyces achromogenes]|uniref:Uncharacterized protein n=1 Tax=Streptomyces achromogenes TaxID=67255 RepID=A0ABU0PVE3_STRAH|nr:hypothetical protein [Streptomyces achromogenes]MDQ0829568.1 hypothetical protein [Streptomyces achromogenes]